MNNTNASNAGIISCTYKDLIARSKDANGEYAIAYGHHPEFGRIGFKVRIDNFPVHILPFCKNAKIGIIYDFNCCSGEALAFNNQGGDVISHIMNKALRNFPPKRYQDLPFIHDPWLLGDYLEQNQPEVDEADLEACGIVTNEQIQKLIDAVEEQSPPEDDDSAPF